MPIYKIYKTKNIIRVSPEDTLAHALSLLSSSHDSAFVVEKNDFLGVINPYYCVIKKSLPLNTKVKNCLLHPPHITIDQDVSYVIKMMIESKIHYLPVFEKDTFQGIISARRILSDAQKNGSFNIKIDTFLKKRHKLISIYENETLDKAIALFKKNRISKLIVLSNDLKMTGILAYYDIIGLLLHPKTKSSSPILKQTVKKFMKTTLLTLKPDQTLDDACNLILKKKIGSIIIMDENKNPIGVLTTRDLLQASIRTTRQPMVETITKALSGTSKAIVDSFIKQFSKKLNKKEKARVIVENEKGNIFKAVISIISRDHTVVIKREGKNLFKMLQSIKLKPEIKKSDKIKPPKV